MTVFEKATKDPYDSFSTGTLVSDLARVVNDFLLRINRLPREAAAYVKLRKLGYSINILSKVFGRSTSMIWRILTFNGLCMQDLRKIPAYVRKLSRAQQWWNINRWRTHWEHWILGEGEKPP